MAPVDVQAILGAVVSPPAWIEMPAVIAGASAGAWFAQRRRSDVVGILALATEPNSRMP
jgi:hypothetical protein